MLNLFAFLVTIVFLLGPIWLASLPRFRDAYFGCLLLLSFILLIIIILGRA